MLQTLIKFIKVGALSVLILLGVLLAVQNRASIDLTFYPLPYVITMPIFLFAMVMLIAGILLGWGLTHLRTFKTRRAHKDSGKRIVALENELTALRSEQLLKPGALQQR